MNQNSKKNPSELSFDHFQLGFPEEPVSVPKLEVATNAAVVRNSKAVIEALTPRHPQNTAPVRMADGKFQLTPANRSNITPATAVVLKNYPRVLERFQAAWGNLELFSEVIREVGFMEANRFVSTTTSLAGRKGFPVEALEEINELIATHEAKYGKFLSLVAKSN